MEDVELVKFVFICVTTFCSVCSFALLLKSKRITFSAHSCLRYIDGKYQAVVTVRNCGEKPLVVSSIRFPLTTWETEPRLKVPKPLKLLSVMDDLTGDSPLSVYVSDSVIEYAKDPSKALACGESITASIPLDEMMEKLLVSNEFIFANKIFNLLYLSLIRIQVITSLGKVKKKLIKWDVRYYLARRYGLDKRLTNSVNAP